MPNAGCRALDVALIAVVAAVAVQVLPLPHQLLTVVSPEIGALRAAWSVDPASAAATLSVDPRLTRPALVWLAATLLLFWTAREALARRRRRVTVQVIVWAGLAVTLLAVVRPSVSPFVNRNHFATWLIMMASLTSGFLASHVRSLGPPAPTLRLRIRDRLADGHGLLLAGALLATIAALAATQSRSGLLGAAAALGCAAAVAGSWFQVPGSWFLFIVRVQNGNRELRTPNPEPEPEQEPGTRNLEPGTGRGVLAAIAIVMAYGVWANSQALAEKFEAAPSAARVTIWRETLPVIRDFWATGTGLGTYGPVMLRYQQTDREVHFNQAHSEYLQIAAEGGWLVLVPLLAATVAAARLARRRLREGRPGFAWVRVGAASGLAGVAVQSVFETGLRVPANALLAALLAAIVLHAPGRARRSSGGAASAARR